MTSWHTYPKIYSIGHAALQGFFDAPVVIQEKVDGSQFSFGLIDGVLKCRSRGKEIELDEPDKMFAQGVAAVRERIHLLTPGWTYRGEYLQKPKHNTIPYARTPQSNIILFDINPSEESYLSHSAVKTEAERIGFEAVECFTGDVGTIIKTAEDLFSCLTKDSALGGAKIEGVVCKRTIGNTVFGKDGKALMAKFVSEQFKERHVHSWKETNPSTGDVILAIAESFRTEAIWEKAIQRLRDIGVIQDAPQDIGPLLRDVKNDIETEWAADIAKRLVAHAMPIILRKVTAGLPEWYKKRLVETQFKETETTK